VSKRKVGFWIEQELYERMVEAADADRRSFSNWLSVTIARAVDDHVAVSRYGWNCDVCGRPVSGRTDEHGASVRHVRNDEADDRAADAWAAAHGE